MALGKQANLAPDLREFAKLAEDWCVGANEVDIPLARLIEFSQAVSPQTTNRALHLARICRAIKAGALLAFNPRDMVQLPYIVPGLLDRVCFRLPYILEKLDPVAWSEKKQARETAILARMKTTLDVATGKTEAP